ncbi:cytochrome P450 CYP94D108-like [Oryza glaberrima]|uniref:Cytochrome P450 n=1 Tax=Oryza glaberrima TaxID=4538 RepID=I1P916_ORYGL|nr:cytochrome P450 CYP94D108-like [Oryza glaberrima]
MKQIINLKFVVLANRISMAAILLLLLVFLVSVALVVRTWSASRRSHEKARYATAELRPYPLVGHLPQFLANRHRILDWMTEVLSRQPTRTFVLRRPGGVRGVITANPANVERFLRSGFDNYPKGERFASLLHDFLGRGIFNADGEAWRSQRKAASYEFNTRSLRAFVARCVHGELHGRLLPLLRRAAAEGRAIDLQDALERFAFDNICRVAFDHDPGQLPDASGGGALAEADDGSTASGRFADAFRDAANLSAGRFRYAVPWFWRVKKALHIGSERRLRESIAIVHDFADRIIRSRREEIRAGLEKHDLLSRFMASHDESYTEVALRDVVISFLLAGRETTSSALTWFFWLLSSRPDVERRIREEVATVRARRGDGDVDRVGFDLDELREMQYVHAAITESMRLYPPVPVDSLHAQEDDVLPDGTAVEAGWFVAYNSYAMGRMESVWGKDAAEFRAERWLEDAAAATFRPESPFRYVSFHGGPRVCLGKEMAYIQMKSIIACVLQELELAVDGAYRPRQVTSLTLRMADGLPTRVKVRVN